MASATRDRARRQRRAPENDNRARRAAEAQQAAYEASRVVLAAAARRRDAAWRHAARASRRRAVVALVAPVGVAIVLIALGFVSSALLIAGARSGVSDRARGIGDVGSLVAACWRAGLAAPW